MRKLKLQKTHLSFCILILLLGGEFVALVNANKEKWRDLQDAYENEQQVLSVVSKIRNITDEYDTLLEKALNDASSSEKVYSQQYRQLGYEGSSESYKDMLKKYAVVQKIVAEREALVYSQMEEVGTEIRSRVKRFIGKGEATLIGCTSGGLVGCAGGAIIDILGIAIIFGITIYAKNIYERMVDKENEELKCEIIKGFSFGYGCDTKKGHRIPFIIPPKVPKQMQCKEIFLKNNQQRNVLPWNDDGKTKQCECANDAEGQPVEICEFK